MCIVNSVLCDLGTICSKLPSGLDHLVTLHCCQPRVITARFIFIPMFYYYYYTSCSASMMFHQTPSKTSEKNWNAEGETGTFPLTCTLYKPVLFNNQYCFTNQYYHSVHIPARYLGFARVFPFSVLCTYVRISGRYRSRFLSWRTGICFL